ncbi:MAG: RAMP superfamily CRISPR-associated protein [Thermodesulfovibrio sp.]|uniref:RAMP superfamily CRISPR-associated protein n=1 Tax=Thermodesulfovibrio sp. N1 TaxID=1871110 RepID=UPI00083A8366|nr:RAMP superfamily CRISPR-associated protein [Thermodesulfovibrio sp. N1]MDI6714681.1 RAMP superfamily CRISPR-associated protein [Thermodesulfovibrio sp.]ODA44130.1 DUF324 domain-containing protein [Thermodesulfovibrio sp. N1]
MLKGKIILKGTIELLSPAIIGSGRDERSDVDILLDSEGRAYIPATSFAGALRHFIKLDNPYKNKLEVFWGTFKEETDSQKLRQSSIKIDDLLPVDKPSVVIRDGVKIDNKKGIAVEGGKFDYEVIEPGAKFDLNIEVTLDDNDDEFKKSMVSTIIKLLENERIPIGAKTNSGFGRIKLTDYKVYIFDFTKKEDVLRWLKQDFSVCSELKAKPLEINLKNFTINADFVIRNSLIVRSYNYNPEDPDIEHIKSKDKPVLPGTSLKGAIRARAERIVKTLGKPDNIITDLFGNVDEKEKVAKKGKLTVEETLIDGYPEEVQTRIKIDRFTGGVIEGALLETKPLFRGKDKKILNLKITINNYEKHEAGLLLLVLKDLWTGDLPIGGEKAIGRGVLEGKEATVLWDEVSVKFQNINQLKEEQKKQLQEFVSTLVNYGGVA